MPFIAYGLGEVDFTDMYFILQAGTPVGPYITLAAARKAGAITVNYGLFFNTILSFITISWVAFWVVKLINRTKRSTESKAVTEDDSTKVCDFCLSVIPVGAKKCSYCTADLIVKN